MVMFKRIVAITFIFICATVAWVILGGTVQYRTSAQDNELKMAVGQLWGTIQAQKAPSVSYQKWDKEITQVKEIASNGEQKNAEKVETRVSSHDAPVDGSDIRVNLHLDQRKKGLLWYSTYKVAFTGRYTVENRLEQEEEYCFNFYLPSQSAVYDNFTLTIDGRKIPNIELQEGKLSQSFKLPPGKSSIVEVTYESQGMDEWWYLFGDDVTQVKNFQLVMDTDFEKIDFPQNSVSPVKKNKANKGWTLTWSYSNLLSGVQIGMKMPRKLNPGPWVSQITYFAPVSLFLFFFLTLMFSTLKGVRLHPMHYFFMGAAFFTYHLLLSYLVDHISIHVAFWICSSVSIFLVISYMRIVAGHEFAFLEIGLSQLAFLVLFSYTFFFQGFTGLTITILCIITLYIVMQMTARLDWERIFKDGDLRSS